MALAAVFLVPVMVFRSMALGMILSVVAVALASLTLLPALLVALGDRVLVRKNTEDADITAESRWQRWTGVALRRPAAVLAIGLVVIGALIVPALGMHLGMPGAKVVDKGNTSRDGYDMLVTAFGPGAAAPAFITTPAADAPTVARIASTVPGVVDARVVTPPAATGRVVVRVTGSTAVDDSRTATLVNTLRSRLVERGAGRAGRRPRRAEPRPHRGAGRTRAVRHRPHPHRRVPAAAHRVPEPRDRAHVDPDEPPHRRRRVRIRDPRVPTRVRHRPPRHPAPTVRRRVGTAVLLRAAVRALDGLPALPARRDPRTLRSNRRHQTSDRRRHRPHRPADHQRRARS